MISGRSELFLCSREDHCTHHSRGCYSSNRLLWLPSLKFSSACCVSFSTPRGYGLRRLFLSVKGFWHSKSTTQKTKLRYLYFCTDLNFKEVKQMLIMNSTWLMLIEKWQLSSFYAAVFQTIKRIAQVWSFCFLPLRTDNNQAWKADYFLPFTIPKHIWRTSRSVVAEGFCLIHAGELTRRIVCSFEKNWSMN